MPDWKTYAKAARNTARKQAPGAAEATRRSARDLGERAGGYARAAGKAVGGTSGPDPDATVTDRRRDGAAAPRAGRTETAERPATGTRDPGGSGGTAASGGPGSSDRWRKDAAAYATVAGRRLRSAQGQAREADLGGRILRAVRDALLIGGSLLVIWLVLGMAGIKIPFTAMIVVVLVIVVVSAAIGIVGQVRRDRQPPAGAPEDDGAR